MKGGFHFFHGHEAAALTRLTRLGGFFIALTLAASAFGASAETPVDGVSARQLVDAMQQQQLGPDEDLHMVTETEGTVQSGPMAGRSLPKETQEIWIFTDPADGQRKVRIKNSGPLSLDYTVNLQTYTLETKMASGKTERTVWPADKREMIRTMVENFSPPSVQQLSEQYQVERDASGDVESDELPAADESIQPEPTATPAPRNPKAKGGAKTPQDPAKAQARRERRQLRRLTLNKLRKAKTPLKVPAAVRSLQNEPISPTPDESDSLSLLVDPVEGVITESALSHKGRIHSRSKAKFRRDANKRLVPEQVETTHSVEGTQVNVVQRVRVYERKRIAMRTVE